MPCDTYYMYKIASPGVLQDASEYLAKKDSILAPIIAAHSPCTIEPHRNYYQELVDSIIGQQLSVKAARSIRQRFYALFGGNELPEPAEILSKSVEELRTAGLSGAKARYVQDLALHVLEGRLKFDKIDDLSNAEVAKELTAVKGIGEWTAHMFMMFCMGRLDILPVGDLGIKNGIKKLYGLTELPDADKIREIAALGNWHPYESVASWYIWQSLDNSPAN
ncbi:DNA-3-methyladenine glycosylase [soil metagenome]